VVNPQVLRANCGETGQKSGLEALIRHDLLEWVNPSRSLQRMEPVCRVDRQGAVLDEPYPPVQVDRHLGRMEYDPPATEFMSTLKEMLGQDRRDAATSTLATHTDAEDCSAVRRTEQ